MFKDIINYITGEKINMIRVAIIKFPPDDNPHEYLCPNKNIDEGDVVYLEDEKEPKL